ncbi:MAG TPA: TetR family transcriptional regulator [Nocardioides bacterium]|uniref:TetR/AcrR family transcriptional regulator n=1 Tax=uncultured Nocardioides sp. TaxID=198441 RepID=UPI000EC7591B|nr:TetR/AcrR family transcriptional regulator [uncultured Nocardioides sp.]HCB07556.1 TetR family transcriptional regulator [Nocardioides sp.]
MTEPNLSSDGRIRRGDETRRVVLRRAVDLASVEGLDGVTIGRLAQELSISKSGLFAHFGSKEELQLATIRAARAIFALAVVVPAREQPAGLARLRALLDGWLDYSRGRQFPGGCFFARATHEYAARPGPVRDALAEVDREWLELVAATVEEARVLGELRDVDAKQLAFELDAYLDSANLRSLLKGDQHVYDLAEQAIERRLASLTG